MRPGISALDCLIADVGFDPGLPGMLTYEATDMLLRRRRLDPTLHAVIWQVGVVGELGYNRGGYANHGLNILIDRLEAAYGADYELTHYIGGQYFGATPRIEQFTIAALRNPQVAKVLTTLSTFYLAPAGITDTDPDIAAVFNAATPPASQKASRDLTGYSPRDLGTLRSFADLRFSDGYKIKRWDPVLRFLMRLSRAVFRARFEGDAATVLDGPDGAELTERQKSLLFTRDQRAIVAAITESGVG
jgi:hypothetical protein